MEFSKTVIPGCLKFKLNPIQDSRGEFMKLFQFTEFAKHGTPFEVKENYLSTSKYGVVRGLHFQAPPQDHDKIVICLKGKVFDVVMDLRKTVRTYGQVEGLKLDSAHPEGLLIPRGCAHGFQALADNTVLAYFTNTEYSQKHDLGIRWDSAGILWPIQNPTVSDRDQAFPPWAEFRSPFE